MNVALKHSTGFARFLAGKWWYDYPPEDVAAIVADNLTYGTLPAYMREDIRNFARTCPEDAMLFVAGKCSPLRHNFVPIADQAAARRLIKDTLEILNG